MPSAAQNLRSNLFSAASCLACVRFVTVLAYLSGTLLWCAPTKVTLSANTNPTTGQAGFGSITVTGSGFPSGTIPPANVTVTLTPKVSGSGPTGTATATAVTVVSGTTERVAFTIPTSIVVTAPTAYKVTIAGSTSTGSQFTSRNSAALTVNPPSKIASLLPTSANAGMSLPVVITGLYTNFVQGTTQAGFGPNVSVGGAAQGKGGPVTVTSPTTATAQITISATAPSGPVNVTVATNKQIASLPAGFTIIPPAQITSVLPNSANAGSALSVSITGLNTSFVQGTTVASFGAGISVSGAAEGAAGPVTVNSPTSATAQITIDPAATAGATTVTVTTGYQIAALAGGFTIIPPAQITSLSPNSAAAALSLPVIITGQYTSFVQGQTVASFGPSVAVGGGAEGVAGPVTVTSPTTATAQIAIDPAATTGPVTVTVTTGSQIASRVGGFTINAAVAVVNITTSSTLPLPPGFSGFCDEYLLHGIEANDPKWVAMLQPLKPGFIRYPGGLPSMAFDWQTAHMNQTWINNLTPLVGTTAAAGMQLGQILAQAKGGACFTPTIPGTCYSDFATLANTLGMSGMVDFNAWTDTHTNSGANMVAAAKTAGLNIVDWELANEPYVYPKLFANATTYANDMLPYDTSIASASPAGPIGVFYQGAFSFVGGYQAWDNAMAAYSLRYWGSVSMHIYPITSASMTTSVEEQTLNGVLAHGTNEYITSYVQPLIGTNTPLFLSEMNSDAFGTMAFESYIYNGIFLAEYVARMSTAPNVQSVAVEPLFLGNSFNQGIIRAVNDYQSYLVAQVRKNPTYQTNTATNPSTQYSFYYSTNALALEVLNQAVNSSNLTWATTVSGGPTVPILGYDGNPIPAVFAQGYQGTNGTHYLVITNKSGSSVPLGVEVNGTLGPASVTVSYVSSASDTAQNTAALPTAVQVVNTTWTNPMTIGPYSVTTLQW